MKHEAKEDIFPWLFYFLPSKSCLIIFQEEEKQEKSAACEKQQFLLKDKLHYTNFI
jgi:hypothetical protein